MEIFSYTMSMDILHLATDPTTGKPLFSDKDINTTQIIMIDDVEEGPYYELWQLLADKPIQRLSRIKNHKPLFLENVIIPFPGATNPLWQGHWESQDCTHSEMLSVFIDRILEKLAILQERDPAAPLVLAFIDRKKSRRLKHKDKLFHDLGVTFPNVQINVVDFAGISFREQIALVQKST